MVPGSHLVGFICNYLIYIRGFPGGLRLGIRGQRG